MTDPQVRVDVRAETRQFEQEMGKAEKAVKDFSDEARNVEQPLERATAIAGRMATAVTLLGTAAVAAGGYLVKVTKDAYDLGIELDRLNVEMGISHMQLAEYGHMAKYADVNQKEFAAGVQALTKHAHEAANGNQRMVRIFKDLGISVRDTNGQVKDGDTLLREFADSVALLSNGWQKAELVQAMMGNGMQKLIPLLNGGARGLEDLADEARRTGHIMDEETAKAASKLEEDMLRLRNQFGAFGRELGRDIIPWLADLVAKLVDASKAAGGLWAGLDLFMRSPGTKAGREAKRALLQSQLDDTESRLAGVQDSTDGPAVISPTLRATLYRRRNKLLEQLGELGALEAEANKREERETAPAGSITPPRVDKDPSTRVSKQPKNPVNYDRLVKEADEAYYKWRLEQEKIMAAAEEQLAREEKKRVDDLTKSSEKGWKEYYENTTERANEYARMLVDVNRKQVDSFADLKDAVDGWGRSFSRTMGEAVITGNLTTRSIGDAFQNLAIEIASKQIQKRITDPLVRLGTSFLDAIFGGSSSLVPVAERPTVLMPDPPVSLQAVDWEFADGGVMTSRGAMPLRRYSRGGIANRPQIAMFGEGDDAEAYVPLPDGRRIPVAMQSAKQSIVVRIENSGSPKQVSQAVPTMTPEGLVIQLITTDMMTGGPISQSMERTFGLGRSAA